MNCMKRHFVEEIAQWKASNAIYDFDLRKLEIPMKNSSITIPIPSAKVEDDSIFITFFQSLTIVYSKYLCTVLSHFMECDQRHFSLIWTANDKD